MSVTIQQGEGNVRVLRIEGVLRKPEFDAAIQAEALRWDPKAQVRVLVLAGGFEGWEGSEEWGDVSFFIEHGDRIEKIAIVADRKWETDLTLFAGAGFRRAPVEFFTPDQAAKARTWLTEG
jgi:hypothetical protein